LQVGIEWSRGFFSTLKEVIKIRRYIIKVFFALVLIILFLSIAPVDLAAQDSLYEFREFTVRVEKYPPGKNPYASVEIRLDGTGTFTKRMKTPKIELEKTRNFKVTVKQLEYLYYQVMRSHFFEIGKTLGNPNMREGTIVRVTVKVDSQMHQVTMFDERYIAVDDIIDTILEVVPKKLREEYKNKGMDFSEVKLP